VRKIVFSLFLLTHVFLVGCQAHNAPKSNLDLSYYSRIRIDKRSKKDKNIDEFIKPYREQLREEMSKVIGYCAKDMPVTRKPTETLLGNFVSDVVLATAKKFSTVDCSIINSGGLRASLFKGEIKVRDIFQLMPFENKIVIVEYTGKQLKNVVEEIVHDNGVPLSGMTIVANSGVIDAFVHGKELNEQKRYSVATIDYVANGGGGVKSMWKGKIIKETHVLLREAIIEYVIENKTILQSIEGRVVIQ